MKVTLKQIKAKSPCEDGWKTLLKSLNKKRADDTEVSIAYIAKSNDISDALWVLFNVLPDYPREKAMLMADIAESVLHIYEKERPRDSRVRDCIQAIRDFADGKISRDKLRAAAYAAYAAADAARAAAYAAARAAADAAYAARAAARAAVYAAVYAAADAYAARAAVREREQQLQLIIKWFGE